MGKQIILIADDSEMNRSILADMLEDEYEIIEAENGIQAVAALQRHGESISLVLLDIVMPELDGFGVLKIMKQRHWIDDIPVIMISAEAEAGHVERAYELGITDFISRPFDALIVHRRVVNTILLYAKQKKLVSMVADQIYAKEQQSNLMIDILSHIVEFRNGESGLHVLHIRTLTELFLRQLVQITDRYPLTRSDISLISTASALHDIGKIAVPSEILNKPGRLTAEEFAVMKTHALEGDTMLRDLPIHQDEPLVKTAYEICRWHHERYDGSGYPDGLRGDDIPIYAQIVALADVYDALTSERVYKKAFSHEAAIQMILDGKCGAFNPLLLRCLTDTSDIILDMLGGNTYAQASQRELQSISAELLQHEELSASERTLQLLEHERVKYSFFAAMSEEIQFEYTVNPPMLTVSSWGAEKLGIPELIVDPMSQDKFRALLDAKNLALLTAAMLDTTAENPVSQCDFQINCPEGTHWFRVIFRVSWSADEQPRLQSVIGKAVDIQEARGRMENLRRMASHDSLTALYNHIHARAMVQERMDAKPSGRFALVILDVDTFRRANESHGHMFGDQVLSFAAEKLRQSIQEDDIAARVGGDEFLLFLEYQDDLKARIERVRDSITGEYADFPLSVSIGVAETRLAGTDYCSLFHAADQALYAAKQAGTGQCRFYEECMRHTLSLISPIDDTGMTTRAFESEEKLP